MKMNGNYPEVIEEPARERVKTVEEQVRECYGLPPVEPPYIAIVIKNIERRMQEAFNRLYAERQRTLS